MQIFVGNLALSTTEDELRQLFAPYGNVERVEIVKDRSTGYSRGFGFVHMPDATQARAAMLGLEGARLGGRALHLEVARARAGHHGGQSRASRGGRGTGWAAPARGAGAL